MKIVWENGIQKIPILLDSISQCEAWHVLAKNPQDVQIIYKCS